MVPSNTAISGTKNVKELTFPASPLLINPLYKAKANATPKIAPYSKQTINDALHCSDCLQHPSHKTTYKDHQLHFV